MASNPKTYLPIHTSDRIAFKKCRRRWNWSSPTRDNLVPKRSQAGLIMPLWYGTGIHAAIEHYYKYRDTMLDPISPEDIFDEWFGYEMVKLHQEAPSWYDEHFDELDEHHSLGVGMLENYVKFAQEHDNFKVIKTEYDFAVDLGFQEYDRRNGLLMPVRYCGRQDLIIQDLETGLYGIMDHKTAVQMGEDYFERLALDEQCTSYLWASRHDPELEALGVTPSFVYYNVLRKAIPHSPTITYATSKQPKLSISRDTESTTLELWDAALDSMQLRGTEWHQSEKVQNYETYLREVGWEQFFIRKLVLRNEAEVHNIGEQIKLEAHDMLDLPNIYPNPSESWFCTKCPFRAPCLATNDGSDVDYILSENYESNTDR